MKARFVTASFAAFGIAASLAGMTGVARAQSSANFQLEQPRLNAGGHPANGVVMSSANYTISLDSIGGEVATVSMASPSFQMAPGIVSAYRPPTEVAPTCGSGGGACLTVTRSGASAVALSWPFEPSRGSYNLYRDTLSGLTGLGFGACYQPGLTTESATDADASSPGQAMFYLVTAVNPLGEQGTKGFRSNGAERLGVVCP